MDRYDGEIAYVDDQLALLIAHVQEAKAAARTVWIIHGTHGEAFGEHGLKGHPAAMFEEIIHVPLIIRLPGGEGRRVPDPVSVLDLPPTIMELAGASAKGLPGRSLRCDADGSPPTESDAGQASVGVLVSYPGSKPHERMRAWVEPSEKLVVQGARTSERVSLWELSGDRVEKEDVAARKSDDVKRMRQAMDAFVSTHVPDVAATPAE